MVIVRKEINETSPKTHLLSLIHGMEINEMSFRNYNHLRQQVRLFVNSNVIRQ